MSCVKENDELEFWSRNLGYSSGKRDGGKSGKRSGGKRSKHGGEKYGSYYYGGKKGGKRDYWY